MDQIKHKFVKVNGSNLHLAEIGAGDKVVVCLHGFPEIWYSWRHQMIALASAGFRVIAPNHRGYGLSDSGLEPEKTKFADLIADFRSILDFLNIPKLLIAICNHRWRSSQKISVCFPVTILRFFTRREYWVWLLLIQYHKHRPEGFYFIRWKEPGRAEANFSRFDSKTVIRKIYTMFSKSEVLIASQEQEVLDLVDTSTTLLPAWFTEEDLETYRSLYEKSGFRTALQAIGRLTRSTRWRA
ncbi:Bifunctional epoxide hydrolase 2 [Linum perenne]